jgi:hypothetical protein
MAHYIQQHRIQQPCQRHDQKPKIEQRTSVKPENDNRGGTENQDAGGYNACNATEIRHVHDHDRQQILTDRHEQGKAQHKQNDHENADAYGGSD